LAARAGKLSLAIVAGVSFLRSFQTERKKRAGGFAVRNVGGKQSRVGGIFVRVVVNGGGGSSRRHAR